MGQGSGLGHTSWVIRLLVVLWLGLLEGCSSGGPTGTPLKGDGDSCNAAKECADGRCEQGRCVSQCASNDDCSRNFYDTCGVTENGRQCMQACSTYLPSGYTCVDDVPTACSVAGDGHCSDCGCPSSLRCVANECVAKVGVGEKCRSDLDCKSDNCSDFAGVCRQPVGAACSTLNCDICITSTGSSYCSRECSFTTECGAGDCLGSGDFYYCHLPCAQSGDPTCPGSCRYTSGGGTPILYCDCGYDECSLTEDPHPLGARCRYDSDCYSGQCDRVAVSSDAFEGTSYEGICSKPCEVSSDCGEGFSCATVGTPRCLPHCESSCAVGGCVELPTAEGATAKACWAKHSVGGFCVDLSDCQTSNCIAGACAEAGGQANGKTCAANADCLSKACQSGTCRGQGLQGDACTIPADCAVGTCCTSGAQANTCALTCG